MRALASFALICSFAALDVRAADNVSVDARRREDTLEVTCRALLDAPLEIIWRTLTDYDRLAEFIPGMRRSRVISRSGGVAIVEQSGEARFLMFSVPIEATLSSTERPPYSIEAALLRGSLKRLEGVYRIEPRTAGRFQLTWIGVVETDTLPPLLGELVLRASIEEQFRGMVAEIERRASQAGRDK